jgi:hypothetical protein
LNGVMFQTWLTVAGCEAVLWTALAYNDRTAAVFRVRCVWTARRQWSMRPDDAPRLKIRDKKESSTLIRAHWSE